MKSIVPNIRHDTLSVPPTQVKLEFYGEEVIDKLVKASGNSGRIYLPPDWVGSKVKIVRLD